MRVNVATLKNFINVLGIAMNGDMVITRKPEKYHCTCYQH